MVTAYDTPSARIVDRAGVDMVLVGDSLGMVMLGRKDTLSVTLDEMIPHCRAVVQGNTSRPRRCGHAVYDVMNPGLIQRFPTRRTLSGKAASGP